VQRGAFGACLMAEPELVADCMQAMQDAVSIPVTVKHRLGLDRSEDYGFVRRFVGTLARAGCRTFLVHARNAVLKGLSPKDNREVPPLRYAEVHRLKHEFPEREIVVNGGVATWPQVEAELARVDGVMLGRAAYHDPYVLADLDHRLFGGTAALSRAEVVRRMHRYAVQQVARGTPLRAIARHMLGLYHGRPGGRRWRQMLSDATRLATNDPELLLDALAPTEARAEAVAA
jgi:tRNA-dihydrouridine synthase A